MPTADRHPEEFWFVDEEIRAQVADLRDGRVERVSLLFKTRGFLTVEIADPGLTGQFVRALQNAYRGGYGVNRVDRLTLHFPRRGLSRREPITLGFHVTNEDPGFGCFGPAFQEALRAAGRHEAARLRALFREKGKRVRALHIRQMVVTDESEVRRLMRALADLDDRAVNLLSGEALTPLLLRFADEPALDTVLCCASGSEDAVLPPPLPAYIRQALPG